MREFLFNLQRFAEGGDPGTGGEGNPNPGGEKGGGEPNGGEKGAGKVSFTEEQQAEIDRLIAERLSRAEKKGAKSALETKAKELGFESVEAMETALKAHREAEDKKKSDLEREKEARVKAESEAKAAKESAKQMLIRAALLVEAGKAGAVDPEDVVVLASREGIEVGEDGKVTGADKAVQVLVKAKPHLFKAAGVGTPGANFRGDQGSDDPAALGKQMAETRNKGREKPAGAYDPWAK
ncbi:MAG: hypothetical protein QME79_12515 [Bacillota bacterium]|nr:hypothetical protein [Bacillota bacterium]